MSTSVMELMNEYTKVMYESSKMAADASVKELPADKTIECIIKNDEDWENGRYLCSYQNGTIWAYSLSEEHYEVETVVYVTVPQSDFDKQKFIIGKKVNTNENEIYNYEFPFDDFIKLDRLCLVEGEFDYRANQPEDMLDENEDSPWQMASFSATLDEADAGNRGKAIMGNKLGISMTIQSELDSWEPAGGNYGARILVSGYVHNSEGQENTYKETEYYFDKYNMYGNVYAYTFPVEQQVVFDVSDYVTILSLTVDFWQDCQFVDQFNDPINWQNEGGSKVPCNIHISNISVYTGYKKGDLDTSKLYLYTYDKLIYGEDPQGTVARTDMDTRSMFISLIYQNRETGKFTLAQTAEELEAMGAQLYWYIRDESWSNDYVTNKVYHNENGEPQPDWLREDYGYAGIFWAPISGINGFDFPTQIVEHTEPVFGSPSVRFLCDINKSRYQFRVVAVIGSDLLLSDILTFRNAVDVEGLNSNLAINDTIVLRPAMLLSTADGTNKILYPDEQFQNFFVYDENNRVLYTKDTREIPVLNKTYDPVTDTLIPDEQETLYYGIDNVKYSDIDYFLELWVRADVFGLAQETADEHGYVRVSNWKTNGTDQYVPFTINWELPEPSYSMLEFEETNGIFGLLPNSLQQEAYYNSRAQHTIQWVGENGVEDKTLFEIDQMTTRMFHIRDSYDMTRSYNTVSCTIERNGQKYTAKREFLFGRASAQGCDYTPIIQIKQPEGNSYLVTGSHFEISCYVIDNHGDEVLEPYQVQWSTLGEAPLFEISQDTRTITGTMGNECLPFVLTATIIGLVNWDLHVRRGMMVTNSPTFLIDNTVYCPSRVEFNSSGQAPHYATQSFECRRVGETEEARTYFYPIWHLNTPSNSFGSYIHLIPEPVYLTKYYLMPANFSYDAREDKDRIFAYVDLDMCWHVLNPLDPDFLTQLNDYKNKNILFEAKSETYAQYYGSDADREAGVLTTEKAPISYTYRLAYDSGDNGIQGQTKTESSPGTAWQWSDAYATDIAYFTWLDFTWKDNEEDETPVKVAQAIAYDRYYYPSSLVNDWDGKSLSLDAENSAIFSTMIAAGTKDTSNRFTGVMMGNWVEHGDSSFDSLNNKGNSTGIYGVHNGEFSFAFLDDGTGYIGPAGKGRIQFDGRNALISNSDQTCYLNLNPNQIRESGNDFGINWYNTQGSGISQYFLYCKVPIDLNSMMFQADERTLSWADPYMDDDDNNYFIVDPVHGALMSGGIVSKYGRIGNWYINSTGLYQKYKNNEESYDEYGNFIGSSQNRFIYLGMPGVSKDDLYSVKRYWDQKLQDNETARQNRINNTGETDLNQTEIILRDLYQYLNKSLMSIDVYHYYTSSLAIQMFLDYVQPFIDKYDNGEYESTNLMVTEIYNYDNLTNSETGIYRYDNINQYLHNHYLTNASVKKGVTYPKGTRTMGSQGLQPNIWKVMGYNSSYIRCNYVVYISPDDILYQYYSGDYTNSSTYRESSEYYTVNQIGDIRVYSYDPEDFPNKIRTHINSLTIPYNAASDLKLTHDHVSSQTSMNGHWWEPTLHPDDTDGTIKNKFWYNNQWRSATQPAQFYMNANGNIDLDGLRGWMEEAKIYLYYAKQQYNQVLFRQLETGLEDLEAHKNDNEEALEKYNTAMNIVNSYGGLEYIRTAGLSDSTGQDESFINTLTEEEKARIEKLKLDAINRYYDDLAVGIKAERAQKLREKYCENDTQKYAIYAGYNSPWDWPVEEQAWSDPLFGVKWNGYLIARQGKIGRDSPWYISDAGLTQKNNFGTIFLGNPETSGMPISPLEYSRSIQGKEINYFVDDRGRVLDGEYDLLPNLGYVYFVKDDDYYNNYMATLWASQEDFANEYPNIEKSNLYKYKYQLRDYSLINNNGSTKSWIHIYQPDINVEVYYMDYWDSENLTGGTQIPLKNDQVLKHDGNYYRRITEIVNIQGPTAYNEHGAYAIYGGQNQEINFGVRLDGTLFSKRGSIGGWRIEQSQLVNYVNDIPVNNIQNSNEGIALDAENHQIRLHGSDIVLDGANGVIFMGRPTLNSNHEASTFNTDSHLIMSNVNITSHTVGVTQYSASAASGASTITLTTGATDCGQLYSVTLDGITYGDGTVSTGSISSEGTKPTMTFSNAAGGHTSYTYDGGFYTICYNQMTLLDAPAITTNELPVVSGSGGIGLAFQHTQNYNTGYVALYPFKDDSQLGINLSIDGYVYNYRWNITATRITARYGIWLEDGEGNLDAVVTSSAFQTAINTLTGKIDDLYDLCDGIASDVANCFGIANTALNKANSAIGLAIKELGLEVTAEGAFRIVKITGTRFNNGTVPITTGAVLAGSHNHNPVLSRGTGTLKVVEGGMSDTNADPVEVDICTDTEVSISAGSDGTGSDTLQICNNTVTFKIDVKTPMETAFKNGWNAAIAAANSAIQKNASLTVGPGNSSDSSVSITVTGGDGKDGISKTLKLSLSNDSTATSTCTDGSSWTGVGGAWRKSCTATDPDRVWCYTDVIIQGGSHSASAGGSASASVSIS